MKIFNFKFVMLLLIFVNLALGYYYLHYVQPQNVNGRVAPGIRARAIGELFVV
jgi:hypothetical protein